MLFGTQPVFLFVLGQLVSIPPRGGGGLGRGFLGAFLLLLGIALCANKDWSMADTLRLWLGHVELVAPPNLFQSQLAAAALYFGVLACPWVWRPLASGPCRHLGRLSFSIYLLHFPILFTLGCLMFIGVTATLSYAASVTAMFAAFIGLTLFAAIVFERWIDRPAIALSRRAGAFHWQEA